MMSRFSLDYKCSVLVFRGSKLLLSFLPTIRRMEGKVAVVSSLAAAALSGWTPGITQYMTELHVKVGKTLQEDFIFINNVVTVYSFIVFNMG